MPNYIRWREDGATYFFTVVTYKRRSIFVDATARSILRKAIQSVQRQLPFQVLASVLLPDHLHCIWSLPEAESDFPERWRQIKERFTRGYLKVGGMEAVVTASQGGAGRRGVWQPRYWEHRIRDERDYLQHRDYIHLNPVKHGLVESPEAWPWSSFHSHVAAGMLDPHWPGSTPVELPEVYE